MSADTTDCVEEGLVPDSCRDLIEGSAWAELEDDARLDEIGCDLLEACGFEPGAMTMTRRGVAESYDLFPGVDRPLFMTEYRSRGQDRAGDPRRRWLDRRALREVVRAYRLR